MLNPTRRPAVSIPSVCRAALAALLAAAPLLAGPLPRTQVPAEAKWVVHLDVEQFAPSQTCKFLMSGQGGTKSLQALLNHYQTLLGIDPLKDLLGLTLYGSELTGDRGTALICGALNHQAIIRQLSTYPQYATRSYGKLTLHTWMDRTTGRPLWACFQTTRLLILASDENSVLAAVATLNGTRPNLTAAKPPAALPIPAVREGTFFLAATKGYAGAHVDPVKALILRSTDSASLQLAEKAGTVDGQILLKASSPESADQIHQILNGLMVSATLTDSASPLARLASMSEVAQEGQQVSLRVRCPARDAADILAATLVSQ